MRGGSLRQMGGVGMLLRHAERFDLTDKQCCQLEDMRVDFELEKVDIRAAMRKAKIRLRASMRKPEPCEKDVMSAIDEVAHCEAEIRRMAFRHLQASRAVLKEDQCHTVNKFNREQECKKVDTWRQQRHAG